jgi:dTDP-4-dehydrorhamnose reductase
MLGQDLITRLDRADETVVGLTRRDLDITDAAAVTAAVRDCRPDVLVNCAAWTAVDDAEAHEEEALLVKRPRGASHRQSVRCKRRPPDSAVH